MVGGGRKLVVATGRHGKEEEAMEHMTHNGVALALEDAGKGAPPFLLVHDLGLDHTSLQAQFEHFRHRHRVVAVDLPGHGESVPLPTSQTPAAFAHDLAWLCYELGVYRPVAVGHGVGGMVAVELAGMFPGLLAAAVLLDSPILSATQTAPQDFVAPVLFTVPTLYVQTEASGA